MSRMRQFDFLPGPLRRHNKGADLIGFQMKAKHLAPDQYEVTVRG